MTCVVGTLTDPRAAFEGLFLTGRMAAGYVTGMHGDHPKYLRGEPAASSRLLKRAAVCYHSVIRRWQSADACSRPGPRQRFVRCAPATVPSTTSETSEAISNGRHNHQ
jgi:hypothetical protein